MSKTPEEMAKEYADEWHKDCDYPPDILRHTKKATATVFLAGYQAAKNSASIDTIGIDTGTKMQWISVKDRLPDEGVEVLIFGKILNDISKTLGVRARFRGDQSWKYTWESEDIHIYTQDDVTHWMPLPAPPKEEK